MKKLYTLLVLAGLALPLIGQQTGYPLRFQFKDARGMLCDTLMNRMKFKSWGAQPDFPAYLQWKQQPFAVKKSAIHGLGLFADSSHTFQQGDTLCVLFSQRNTSGYFELDYLQSNPGSFINDSQQPNAEAVLAGQNIVMVAIQTILPESEITVSYRQLLNLLGSDNRSAARVIKYW